MSGGSHVGSLSLKQKLVASGRAWSTATGLSAMSVGQGTERESDITT